MAKLIPFRAKPCPVCAKAADPAHGLFCSSACKNEDLRRWLGGDYRVPSEDPIGPAPEAESEDEPPG